MHNGGIAEFDKVKRRLQNSLTDDVYHVPQGNTGEADIGPLLDFLAIL